MKLALTLLSHDVKLKLKASLAFRLNFGVNLLSALLFSFMLSLLQFLVFTGADGYPGWTGEQLLFFQAALVLWTGVSEFLFGGVRQLVELEVAHGHFDRFLLWPVHPLVSLLTRGSNVYALASILAGLVGMLVMGRRLDLAPGPLDVALSALFFGAGLVLYVSLVIVYCGCTLFWVKMERLREVLDRLVFFGSFPADIYFGPAKTALWLGFPLALWVHLPVQALLGRAPLGALGAVATSAVAFVLALRFWERQQRLYTSAGG
jgi:ABC-2 type transport system permease protein